jgi:hypothetical protein
MQLKKLFTLFWMSLVLCLPGFSQVGIGTLTPDPSSTLDVTSTTSGLLVPRMTTTQRLAIITPADGLLVFDITTDTYWYFKSSTWTELVSSGWSLLGNTGTNPPTQFIGTTDNKDLVFKVNGIRSGLLNIGSDNTFLGYNAGFIGSGNVAMGSYALMTHGSFGNTAIGEYAMYSGTGGFLCTAIGQGALGHDDGGNLETAVGAQALANVTFGGQNTAVGYEALNHTTTGASNTAVGNDALYSNTWAGGSTAVGDHALYSNVSNFDNTAVGYNALTTSNGGDGNTAVGSESLWHATTGNHNTSLGAYSMQTNTTGSYNTALGWQSLGGNTTGNYNIAIGMLALSSNTTGQNNVSIGNYSGTGTTTGSGNVFIGYQSGSSETGDNKLYIANSGTSTPLIYGDFANSVMGINGQVGIGTQTPNTNFQLHVYNSAAPAMSNILIGPWWGGSPGAPGAWINSATAGGTCGLSVGGSRGNGGVYWNDDTQPYMFIQSANPVLIQPGGASQYVGIGTINPTNKLHVSSINPLRLEGLQEQPVSTEALVVASNGVVYKGGSGSGLSWSLTGNSNTDSTANFIGTTNAQAMIFKTNNAERIRINMTGNVGIGTINPLSPLHISKNATGDIDMIRLQRQGTPGTDLSRISFYSPNENNDPVDYGEIGVHVMDLASGDEAANIEFWTKGKGDPIEKTVTIGGKGEVDILSTLHVHQTITGESNISGIGSYILNQKPTLIWEEGTSSDDTLVVANDAGWKEIQFKPGGTQIMNIRSDGNVGIGTLHPSVAAMLDISSTTKGFLAPRMNTAERITLASIAVDGLLVYDTDIHAYFVYREGSVNNWEQQLGSSTGWSTGGNSGINTSVNFLGTTDNQDLVFKVNNQNAGRLSSSATTLFGYQAGDVNTAGHNTFIGWWAGKANTSGDNNIGLGEEALVQNTVGINNIAIGSQAMSNVINSWNNIAIGNGALASGVFTNGGTPWNGFNVAIGNGALQNNQPGSTSNGIQNTGVGHNTLYANTKGTANTAVGYRSMGSNTTAGCNVAIGDSALFTQSFDNSGSAYRTNNTAIGNAALFNNQPTMQGTSGNNNTATGFHALYSNTTGWGNVANGDHALWANTIGPGNSAFGYRALESNTTLQNNVAVGTDALRTQSFSNGGTVISSGNTAVGYQALYFNQPTTSLNGIQNTAVGFNALQNNSTGYNNAAFGFTALIYNTTGSNNTAIGYGAFSAFGTYNNSTALGSNTQITTDNEIRLGDDNITTLVCKGAYAATNANGPNVYVDNNGQIFRSTTGVNGNAWSLTGNSLSGTEILGSTNNQPVKLYSNNTERVRIKETGEMGIGTTNPLAPLHINLNTTGDQDILRLQRQFTGTPSTSTSNLVFYHENSSHSLVKYGQMTFNVEDVTDGSEVGSLVFYTQNKGAKKALTINKDGGIESEGIIQAKSGININGGTISQLIGTTIIRDIPSIAAGASRVETFTVTGSTIGAAVLFNPYDALPDGIVIAYSRVSATDIVEAKFTNITATPVDPPSNTFRIEVFRP